MPSRPRACVGGPLSQASASFGSRTLKKEVAEAGGEPDECYIVGPRDKDVPDLVIEIEWSRALGLAKQEIYRRLGVRELWTMKASGSRDGWTRSRTGVELVRPAAA